MIIFKCDLCNKQVEEIESIVLYKTRLDYCQECKAKAKRIKRVVANSIKYYKEQTEKKIEESEKNTLRRYK